MSKAILISIRPKYVADILNGNKTIEIRKRFPKDYIGWVYIYCTKDKKYANLINRGGFLTGMVVARFWCDNVEKLHCNSYGLETSEHWYRTTTMHENELLKECALTFEELDDYLGFKNGYAIYITKLEIFERPKELNEFCKCGYNVWCFDAAGNPVDDLKTLYSIKKPPQSWCYIEV